jgi:NADH-quinone oxidoreductase subunit C/D
MAVKPRSQSEQPVVPEELKRNVFIAGVDSLYNWGRMYSMWPIAFGLACCAIEFFATGTARYDLARFGAELARASPRQADLMVVSGTVTKKMAPSIVRLYNQMAEPKYVIAMGACATAGGPFKEGYNVVSGIDKYLPVDVYVPGCPPTPQAFLQGLIKLQEKIKGQSITQVSWYRKGQRNEAIPVPILGPDIFDLRQVPTIREELAKRRAEAAQEAAGEEPETEAAEAKPKKAISKTLKLPTWDVTPSEEIQVLADGVNQAIGAGSVTPEKDTLVVDPARLIQVGEYLRDDENLAYDLLSNVTGVDYLGRDPRFEVVYHLYSTSRGGGPLVLKVRTMEEEPVIPSLTSVWPSADLQEREIWDLYGIRFPGHPNLKRILLWEGFHGHPLRKDYQEAYYEEPTKPFNSRWPSGHHELAESKNPFFRNVVYPAEYPAGEDWDPDEWISPGEALATVGARDLPRTGLRTQKIVVNIGPQHPSTHGVFRMVVALDGETVVDVEPVLGYLHRNHEKIGERNGWLMNMPYTDRLDYFNSMGNNFAYALAVEKLMGDGMVPERAQYLRVIMAEFNRVLSHVMLVGFLLNEMGVSAFTPMFYAFKERELILDLFEEASGSRMMCNYMRFGGVAHDVSEDWLDRARYLARERLPRKLDELEQLLSDNEILVARTKGVGVIPPEVAIAYGVTGPMLRAVGVPYDIRRVEPYSVYDRFDFKIPLLYNGDLYDRYLIRILEAREALKILDQALDQIPEGEIQGGKKAWQLRMPAGEAYARIEHPKGELGYYLVSNGSANPWRYRVRSPSFINLTALGEMGKGHKVADIIVILGAIDIVLGEVDR